MDNRTINISKLKLIILGIQLFDILIHVAVNRIEPLRIVSNIVIILWVILLIRFSVESKRWISYVVISLYGILNLWFIISDRVFTYFTGQELGVMFALIVSTLMLSLIMIGKEKQS